MFVKLFGSLALVAALTAAGFAANGAKPACTKCSKSTAACTCPCGAGCACGASCTCADCSCCSK